MDNIPGAVINCFLNLFTDETNPWAILLKRRLRTLTMLTEWTNTRKMNTQKILNRPVKFNSTNTGQILNNLFTPWETMPLKKLRRQKKASEPGEILNFDNGHNRHWIKATKQIYDRSNKQHLIDHDTTMLGSRKTTSGKQKCCLVTVQKKNNNKKRNETKTKTTTTTTALISLLSKAFHKENNNHGRTWPRTETRTT